MPRPQSIRPCPLLTFHPTIKRLRQQFPRVPSARIHETIRLPRVGNNFQGCTSNMCTPKCAMERNNYFDEDQRLGGMDSKKSAQKRQKTMMQKVIHGSMAGLVIFTAPLYALGFGLIGYKIMWRISKVIYGISRPSESILHDHFDRMQKFLETGTKEAALKSKAYMIHPTFAGLSLISSMLLAFVDPLKIEAFIPFHLLLKLNVFICIVSALAARPLTKTMCGNRNAKQWIVIQGNLSMVSAVFAVIPGTFGRLMIHLNWATLFSGGVLERLYVLSFLSQVGATNTKTYIDWYSPQIKVATLLSIPLAIASFMFYH